MRPFGVSVGVTIDPFIGDECGSIDDNECFKPTLLSDSFGPSKVSAISSVRNNLHGEVGKVKRSQKRGKDNYA